MILLPRSKGTISATQLGWQEWFINLAGPPVIVASTTVLSSIRNMYTPRFYNKNRQQYYHQIKTCTLHDSIIKMDLHMKDDIDSRAIQDIF